jgi:hypothetical protein
LQGAICRQCGEGDGALCVYRRSIRRWDLAEIEGWPRIAIQPQTPLRLSVASDEITYDFKAH